MKKVNSRAIVRERLSDADAAPFRTYIDITVGSRTRFSRFIRYELLTSFLGSIPGGLGYYLRKRFYPSLFRRCGKRLLIGTNVVIRHPDKIALGDNVTIDDNCLIDGRGAGSEGIVLGDNVMINRNCMLQAKAGPIKIGSRTSLGSYSIVSALDRVDIGSAVLIGGRCYFSAGAYYFDDVSAPVMDQGLYAKGPIKIGSNAYFGAGAMVVGGITVGTGSVIGAGAVVVKDVPDRVVVAGNPARILREIGIKEA